MLEVRELSVADRHGGPIVEALSFSLPPAGSLAIVGESGSGKTQAALSLLGLQDPALRVGGSVRFDGVELLGAPASRLRALRGARIGFVFQDPSTSLNPYLSVGLQIAETIEVHRGLTREGALAEARRLLEAVRIGDAARRLAQYPHELSGGMRQRVMIAIALAGRPQLLIADEPTTALDVTVQQQLIGLLAELRRTFSLALLLITHDLGLVAELCERTLVLYAGQMMEEGRTSALPSAATHPYTRALLRARPHLDDDPDSPLRTIPGALPARGESRRSCVFAPRCAHAQAPCRTTPPALTPARDGRRRCHLGIAEIGVSEARGQ